MKKYILLCVAVFATFTSFSQLLTWSPQFPSATAPLTITMDATKGNAALAGSAGPIYVHIGVITNLSTTGADWKHATTWLDNTAPYTTTACGTNKWCLTINNPTTYFNLSGGETIQKIAILFRNATGSTVQRNTDGSDMYVPFYTGTNNIRITTPTSQPTYSRTLDPITPTPTAGASVPVTAVASVSGNLTLALNGTQFASTTGTTVSGNATAVIGNNQIVASLNGAAYDTISFFISPVTVIAPLPSGVTDGINYYNCTDSVTLVLYAPNKSSALILGDFNNWTSDANYLMKKTPDGNYYWLTIHGLTSGTEYAYQYLVDNSIYIADAYSQKILDPNDRYINPNSYPNLKPYPVNSNVSAGKNGIVSVLQICEPQYNWTVNNFTKPDKKNLIIYELLVRDFSKPNPPTAGYDSIGNYQTIIDSIGYLKRLGINAVEFMPLQEFGGNISWGYNPNFYFAPDKVYGSKNKLKELIDTLHKNGIAVLLDVVYNHIDAYNTPIGKLYWDAINNRPAANNPWLNATTPHAAYKFFEDFNHTSAATQKLVETSLDHWVNEYKIDGFRFDFTKGFTQTVTTNDNSAYDQSRIDNLNRYWDYISQRHPNNMPYMILEHFCAASEENVLINKGFMPWREMFDTYKESILGTGGNKNFGPVMWNYGGSAAPLPGLVGFMGSHDKERLMYEALQNGGTSGGYSVKNLNTALSRMEAASSLLITIPGPKMLWQFDEFGYDISRGGNTDMRAPHWEYLSNANRLHLLDVNKKLIQLRLSNTAVFNNIPSAYDLSNYFKYFQIGDPTIANTQITIVANFGLTALTQTLTFQKTGSWYNYLGNGTGTGINGTTNATFTVTNTSQSITLQPGEYHVYVSVPPCTSPNPTVNTPLSYCQNSTAPALTATGNGLLWHTTPTNGTGVATLVPSTANAGSLTYYVTQTTGGCSESQRVPLVVNITAAPVQPTASVTAAPSCVTPTGTITVTAPTGANIRYSIDGTTYTNTNGIFTGLTAGSTYSITAKDINSTCVSVIRSVLVPAVPGAPATPTLSVTQATCTIATGTITVTSDKTGLTFSSNGVDYTNTNGIFTIAAGSSFSITAKNTSGCISIAATGTLAAQPITPSIPDITILQPSCTIATATITITSDKTGLVFSNDGTNYTNTTGVFNNITAGSSYSITAKTINGGCVSSAKTGTVNAQPNIPVQPTASVTAAPTCISPTGTITVTAPTGANIRYSIDGTTYTNTTGVFTGLTNNTTYTITAKDINSTCVSAASSVLVPAIPGAPPTPQVNVVQATCTVSSGTVTITSDKTGLTFSSNGIDYTNTNGVFTFIAGSSYSITAKNGSGCVSSPATGTLNAQPVTPSAPEVTVTQPSCTVATATITITSDKAGLVFSNDGTNYTNTTGVFNNITAGSSYSITAKTINGGCVSLAKTGTVNAQPNIPVQPTASVTAAPTCISPTGTISVTSPTGANIRYSIDGNTYTNTTGVFTGLTNNTTYNITARDINSTCISEIRSIQVPAIPGAPPTAVVNVTPITCTNTVATITVTSDKTGLTFSSDGINYTNTNGVFNNIAAGAAYSITAKSAAGCVSSPVTGNVGTIPGPPAAPVVTTPVNYCQGATAVPLTATGVGLKWYTSPTGPGSNPRVTPSTTNAGTTNYYVSQTTDCGESLTRSLIVVIVTATPPVPTGLASNGITNQAATVSWSAVAGASSYTVEYKLATAANWTSVTTTTTALTANITGLTATSLYDWRVRANCDANNGGAYASAQFTTSSFSINNIKNGLGIMVYQNPVTVASKIAYIVPANGACTILLYNSYGQKIKVILNQTVAKGQYEISMSDLVQRLSKGTYFLKITQGGNSNYTKFIKP